RPHPRSRRGIGGSRPRSRGRNEEVRAPVAPPAAETGGWARMVPVPAADRDPLDDYRALNDPERRRAVERRGGYFVVEGLLALEALLASPYPVRSVLVDERRAARVEAQVAGRAPVLVRPRAEVAAIAGFDFPRGVLAAADRLPLPEVDEVIRGARLLLVVEGVGDHENLGALFRHAAAFGVAGVLLDPTTADPLYRRSVRVSLG